MWAVGLVSTSRCFSAITNSKRSTLPQVPEMPVSLQEFVAMSCVTVTEN